MEEDRECEGLQQRKACRVVATIVANARVLSESLCFSFTLSRAPERERERERERDYESHRETERDRTLSLGMKLAPALIVSLRIDLFFMFCVGTEIIRLHFLVGVFVLGKTLMLLPGVCFVLVAQEF